MKYKPNEVDIIDYLSEEMSEEKQIAFEAYLAINPDFREEVEAMKETKEILKKVADEEVQTLVFIGDDGNITTQVMPASLWYVLAIAASLTLLMLVGYTTGLVVKYDKGKFSMFYGIDKEKTDDSPTYLTKEEAKTLFVGQEKSRKALLERIDYLQAKLEQSIEVQNVEQNKTIRPTSKVKSEISEKQILAFVNQLREENQAMIGELHTLSVKEHEQQLQHIFSNFSRSLDERRVEDLELIQTKLSEIKYDSDIKQVQTDQILASIITTVKNQTYRGL